MDIKEYLKAQQVPFDVLPHGRTETAIGTATSLEVPPENFAKTVALLVDGRPVLAVLQADYKVNLVEVKKALGGGVAVLAAEEELEQYFPDCETGAIPPFGSHYGMQTIVDSLLAQDEYIVFDGNTHNQAISMRFADYLLTEKPHQADIRDTSYA